MSALFLILRVLDVDPVKDGAKIGPITGWMDNWKFLGLKLNCQHICCKCLCYQGNGLYKIIYGEETIGLVYRKFNKKSTLLQS